MSMPLMEKGGLFTEPIFFHIPSPFDVKSKHTIGHLVKKNAMLVHRHQLLYVQ